MKLYRKYLTAILIFVCVLPKQVISQTSPSGSYDSIRKKISYDLTKFYKLKEESREFELVKNIGSNYHRINVLDSALYFYRLCLEMITPDKNPEQYSSVAYNLGLLYLRKTEYDTAINYANKALELDRKLGNPTNLATSLNGVALIYQEWGFYEEALKYRLESINISEKDSNYVEIANGYYNLGNIYSKLGKYKKALEYLKLAQSHFNNLQIGEPDNITFLHGLSECFYSIGGLYIIKRDYKNALHNLEKSLNIKNMLKDNAGIGNCYYQIGLTNYFQNNYKEAIQELFLALQYKLAAEDKKGIALTYYRIGSLYFETSKIIEAEVFLHKSIALSKEINDKEILSENYRVLYMLHSSKKQFEESLGYHELYKMYSDSLKNERTNKTVEELSIRYESEKKERENAILTKDIKIKALTIQKQKSLGLFLIGLTTLVFTILLILYILYRSKQKTNRVITHKNALLGEQNTKIAEQKKEIELKNLNLTDSIVYAKTIQDSMLQQQQSINKLVKDSFILYKPKDIVSGDFYWFGAKDEKIIISAIDCTGHGVPGAFMSMLGNSFLNQIILNQGVTNPDHILQQLNIEVQNALKQTETNNQDGMDMALCTIDEHSNAVYFSGAKNPLIYIQNKEAFRIKGDKIPIGISYEQENKFTAHKIGLDCPTFFYMFSDGYPDQFGGPDSKKFMIKRFQKLILDIHEEPMQTQKKVLDKKLSEWMGDEEQVDDILVIGFKLDAISKT